MVIFGNGLAGVAEKYLHKGSKVFVEGSLQTRKWQDQSGEDRYTTEIALKPYDGNLILLDGNRAGGSRSDNDGEPSGHDGSDLSDEVPF